MKPNIFYPPSSASCALFKNIHLNRSSIILLVTTSKFGLGVSSKTGERVLSFSSILTPFLLWMKDLKNRFIE